MTPRLISASTVHIGSDPVVGPHIVHAFEARVAELGQRPALRRFVHVEEPTDRSRAHGRWVSISWAEYGLRVHQIAAGFVELGVAPGDRVALLSTNRVEWVMTDLAIMSIGAITVPIYPTSAPQQVAYVLEHSGSRVCVVEDAEQMAKVMGSTDASSTDRLAELEHVVQIEGAARHAGKFALALADVELLGAARLIRDPMTIAGLSASIEANQLATLVYTSGTTGPPKGVEITHANIAATVRAMLTLVSVDRDDRFLSFLPLSHIAERTVSHFGQIAAGAQTWFAQSLTTLADDLAACRPTVFFAVPRVWEKMQASILERVASSPALRRRIAHQYVELGLRRVGSGGSLPLRQRPTYAVLDRLVGHKIRSSLGLDQARILVSSAAPIHAEVVRWFHAIGVPIAEVWGQTEDCGPATMNPPDRVRIGTVGLPLPGVDVRIANADDSGAGEIVVRGSTVCAGYYRDEAATASLLDDDGWMHTGDLGRFDNHGYLTITGRLKDLLITSSGKNISPQTIETMLRNEPLISQAVVVGDGRPYLTALLTLDLDVVARWARDHHRSLALEALASDETLHALVEGAVDRVNARLSNPERIRRFTILPREFTLSADELTATLKVRRHVITAQYAEAIELMYKH